MNIKWITKDDSLGAVTIYENNIRLSKKAADYFLDAYAIAIGVDIDAGKIVIKKINKANGAITYRVPDSPKIDKIIDDVVNIKNSQFFDKQSLINVFKNNLLLLYISNVNLNDFIGVETT